MVLARMLGNPSIKAWEIMVVQQPLLSRATTRCHSVSDEIQKLYKMNFSLSGLFIHLSRNVATKYKTHLIARHLSKRTSEASPLSPERLSLFTKLVDNDEVNLIKNLYSGAGHEIRIAGGAVRDLLSGKLPHDIDFATTATPNESKALLQNRDNVRLIFTAAGERHGTVTALINRKSQFEITTLRCDTTTDGRHAEVEFIKDWKTGTYRMKQIKQ